MEFIDPDLQHYVELHSGDENELLAKVNRETHLSVLKPRMLSGQLQGRMLSMISHMIRPQYILEVGTYTGYSALCFAEGMIENGKLVTIDINEELEDRVKGYFAESGYGDKIEMKIGPADQLIPQLDYVWDLVFIDADKINYGLYYDLVIDRVAQNGFIIVDNVLWSGKVLEKYRKKLDEDTAAILAFNKKVHDDPRVENVLFPVRDGLMILRKK
ncbi:MAG: O-methyltransferase [Bacteroidota bacterium]